MSELVTLSKNNQDFESYLLGTFSKEKRALPIQTLNVNSASETVTFRVLDKKNLVSPSPVVVWFQAFKIRSIIFVLVPLLMILTKNIVDRSYVDYQVLILTFGGAILAFLAASLRNDFMDHMKGIDRVLDTSGSRVIQKGWLTAEQVKNLATVFLVCAVIFAAPLVFVFPQLSIVFIAALIVGLWAQFQKGGSFKYRIGGELALFLLLGPLFTVGMQMALTGRLDGVSIWIGFIWGWAVLFIVHLRNFLNILPSAQAGFANTVNWLGFDRSRRLLAIWWAILILLNAIYHWRYSNLYVGLGGSVLLAVSAVPFVLKLKSLSSPAGSSLLQAFRMGYNLFLLAVGLWVLECLWYLLS